VAVDGEALHELRDLPQGGAAGVGDELRFFLAVVALHVVIARVDGHGDVRGRVAGLAGGDGFLLDDGDAAAFLRQQDRGGEAGDACADDGHVHVHVAAEGLEAGGRSGGVPEGGRLLVHFCAGSKIYAR
jgi:hypothetical protein